MLVLDFPARIDKGADAGCWAGGPVAAGNGGVSAGAGSGAGGWAGCVSGLGGGVSEGFFRRRIRKAATATTAPTAAIIPIIISHGRPAEP